MAAPREKAMGPAMKRTLPAIIAIDFALIGAGMLGYSMTHNVWALFAPVALACVLVTLLCLRAIKQDAGPVPPKQGTLVE